MRKSPTGEWRFDEPIVYLHKREVTSCVLLSEKSNSVARNVLISPCPHFFVSPCPYFLMSSCPYFISTNVPIFSCPNFLMLPNFISIFNVHIFGQKIDLCIYSIKNWFVFFVVSINSLTSNTSGNTEVKWVLPFY